MCPQEESEEEAHASQLLHQVEIASDSLTKSGKLWMEIWKWRQAVNTLLSATVLASAINVPALTSVLDAADALLADWPSGDPTTASLFDVATLTRAESVLLQALQAHLSAWRSGLSHCPVLLAPQFKAKHRSAFLDGLVAVRKSLGTRWNDLERAFWPDRPPGEHTHGSDGKLTSTVRHHDVQRVAKQEVQLHISSFAAQPAAHFATCKM